MTAGAPIDLVTVSYRSGQHVAALLRSLAADEQLLDQVIVVNNAVDDRLEFDLLGTRVVESGDNLGYGRAMNLGAALGVAPHLLLVNPDVEFQPGALAELLRRLRENEDVGAVGPLIRTLDGSVYPSARRLPSLRIGVGHALFSGVWPNNPWTRRYRADEEDPPRIRTAGWLSGSCLLVRREAFEQIGGFDAKYFMYFEDVDLGTRLGRAGWSNLYVATATVHHEGGHSTRSSSRGMIRAHHESAILYVRSKYAGWYLAPLRWALTLGLRVRARLLGS